jgi:serine protease Do
MIKKIVTISTFLLAFAGTAFAKELPDFTELAEKQGPSVVNISVTQVVQGNGNPFAGFQDDEQFNELFRRFGLPVPGAPRGQAPQQEFKSQSLGSGFIISSDGYVLTNAHVINAADEVIVKLSDKREFKAKIIGSDRRTDVALLKIDATGLPKVSIGDPNQLKVGEWVAAIGSPFGLENTMTAGIVSAKGRALPQENFVPFIQTDVAINPGNSGGPLFNLKGEVVGINSQIYSRSGGSMGLSFAIPIDVAMDVSSQLKSGGKIARGWLGVSIQEITKDLADSFGMKNTNGALVAGVEKSGPADKGGLVAGDVILKFDGKAINSSSDLPRAVGGLKPGKSVNVEVLRKGATKTLSVVVAEAPNDKDDVSSPSKGATKPEVNRIGLILNELTPQQKKKLNGKNGLLVTDSQGASALAGVRRGDIVLGINNAEVATVEQFNKTLSGISNGKTVAVLVLRGESTLYVPIKVTDTK